MLYVIDNAKAILPGLWSANVPGNHFDRLGHPLLPSAKYTVVAAPISTAGGELRLDPETATVIARGAGADTLFLHVAPHVSEHSGATNSSGSAAPVAWRRDSDAGFLDACRVLVGEEFRHLGQCLLEGFRPTHPGCLLEGKSRKWLNQPSNFVAITIQNRDRSFAVSVRDVPEARHSKLAPKPDRPGYLRFKVSGEADVPEAVRLILASAQKSRRP